jgi:hypothetical protein
LLSGVPAPRRATGLSDDRGEENGQGTASRLAALARERGPAWAHEQLAAQEAAYQAEADIRKAEALKNVEKWTAIRKARGAAK